MKDTFGVPTLAHYVSCEYATLCALLSLQPETTSVQARKFLSLLETLSGVKTILFRHC